MKPNKYVLILLLTVVGYGLFEYYRPRPVDWSPTYTNRDAIPFGTKATYDLLSDVMNGQPVTTVRLPAYNHITEAKFPARSNYIFVNNELTLSRLDRDGLISYVLKGNNAFLSAYYFPDTLMKLLGFRAELKAPTLRDTTLGVNFVNPTLRRREAYHFRHDDGRNYFKVVRPNIIVLARNARQEPIFLKIPFGNGFFYIHNLPLALTNYYVLDEKEGDFAFKSFSYLPPLPTYWDEYQKLGRFDPDQKTSLRYVLSQPPLAWAWYLTLAGLLLFVIFAGKRTQRVIPVGETPRNSSLDFVQTVGRLYFQRGDHANLVQKKIQHFFAFIREKYNLNPAHPDEEFRETLARKSGVAVRDVDEIFKQIAFSQQGRVSEYELLRLNGAIENFYKNVL
ncbi:DUF4350 domain-containing protein [Tellurirhabdus rosea]|uniref:DUF4350 domain-containing protein n=1 Tax=Tellurirhabdus rosea TaxID=2674997 RepID=UPI0022553DC7|nr:DUF4350 domain-containing protein [Tellurirhabdus rosea]